jgi:hypothetical protein
VRLAATETAVGLHERIAREEGRAKLAGKRNGHDPSLVPARARGIGAWADAGCGNPPRPDGLARWILEPVTTHLEIEMPDRSSAFELEDQLRRLYPLAVGRHGVWSVEVDDEGDHLDEVVETTRAWLRAHGLGELVLHVDGSELHVHP